MNDVQYLSSICNILKSILIPENFLNEKYDRKRLFTQAYCFAFIWGVGGPLEESGREKIDSIAKNLFETSDIPNAQQVYDLYMDPKKGLGFRPWTDMIEPFKIGRAHV